MQNYKSNLHENEYENSHQFSNISSNQIQSLENEIANLKATAKGLNTKISNLENKLAEFCIPSEANQHTLDSSNKGLDHRNSAKTEQPFKHGSRSMSSQENGITNRKMVNDEKTAVSDKNDLGMSYITSFTVHGLSRTILGKPYEKIIWSILLMLGLAAACYLCYHNIQKYTSKDIRTEIRIESRHETILPHIVICFPFWTMSDQKFACYKNPDIVLSLQ